jgi:hypothetical protein
METAIIVHLQNLVRELHTKVDLLESENSHLKQQLKSLTNENIDN